MQNLRQFEKPGVVEVRQGAGGLAKLVVTTRRSCGEIYLQGAQVTGFAQTGAHPLLFVSQGSRFAPGKAIRGGFPIWFPWFGARAGNVAHGVARITEWDLVAVSADPEDGAIIRLRLPQERLTGSWAGLRAECQLTLAGSLEVELLVVNASDEEVIEFESCLHTYFAVSDIEAVALTGLKDAQYIDHLKTEELCTQSTEWLQIHSQTDRTYVHTTSTVEIQDPGYGRSIRVEKQGSASTVVWNPWTTQVLADLGPGEYRRLVCVESGNVGLDRISLPPKETARLQVRIESVPLG
jgi:glucose-6-phosphate 1-epimerase